MKDTLKKLLGPICIRIKKGPLKGMRWSAACGMRFVKGNYEPDTVAKLEEYVKPDSVCYDIGAHVGYLSIVMSRLAGEKGRVVAFEPRPANLQYLQRHIRLNDIANIDVLDTGVSDHAGEVFFNTNTGTGTGHITEQGDLSIKIDTIDHLVEEGTIPAPALIKMDIEGAETGALKGAENTLRSHQPILMISTHGDEIHRSCVEFIRSLDYQLAEEGAGYFYAVPRQQTS